MEAFAERSIDTYFEFSILQFFIVLFLSVLIGVIFGATLRWEVGLSVGVGVFLLLYAILGNLFGLFAYTLLCQCFTQPFMPARWHKK